MLWADQINAVDGGGHNGVVRGDCQPRCGEKQLAVPRLQLAAAAVFVARFLRMGGAESPAAGGTTGFVKNSRWKNCRRLLATGHIISNRIGCGTSGRLAAVSG